MKKKRIKILFIYMLLGMSLFIVLGIGVFNKVKEHNREVAIENNEKRKALKKYETEIVKDLSNRYTGIKDVEFTKYTTTPLGTVYFNFYINQNKQKDRISKYAIDEDSKKPTLIAEADKMPVKEGKSDFNNIQIKYNYEEY